LVEKYRERNPEAGKDVRNKFNSLRNNFRKEVKRFKDSKKSGAGTEDELEPTLWYFEEMSFLLNQEVTRKTRNALADEDGEQETTNSKFFAE
jgi:hypothetical protein